MDETEARHEAASVRATRGHALLVGAVAVGTVLVVGIEAASVEHAVRAVPMGALLVVALGAAALVYRREAPRGMPWTFDGGFVALGVVAVALGTLVVAVVAAPNTWDSMTYHLPRVAHWAAEGAVVHYPTAIDRQLWQPPFAEYLVLVSWVLLGGSDRLANLPAWLAAMGSVVVAVEIARALGLSARARRLTALAVATLPTLVLQATSTQTDVVAAFWIAVTAYLALVMCVAPTWRWTDDAWLGAALGLALGTKGTALAMGVPWVLVAIVPGIRAHRFGTTIRTLAIVAIAVVGLDMPHWLRNLNVFNGPLGPSTVQRLLRPAGVDPASVFGNLVANATVHLGTPWPETNARLAGGVRALHARLGLDPATLYPFFGGYRVDPWTTHENVAGNPLHCVVALIGGALALLTVRRRRRRALVFLAMLGACLLLFGIGVRWQPFNARLHLPLFVLLGPLVAATIERLGRVGSGVAAAALFAGSLPALVGNATRPMVVPSWPPLAMPGVRSVFVAPRDEQYFAARRDVLPAFEQLAATLRARGCGEIGLKAGYDGWEYPLWVLLDARPIAHVFVRNASAEIEIAPLAPDWCLVGVDVPGWRPLDEPRRFELAWAEGRVALWR